MTNVIDNICKCRDLLEGDLNKLPYALRVFNMTIDDIHRNIRRKGQDNKMSLDFTSQDLMEFAQDIRKVLDGWEDAMDPEKNIKGLLKEVKDGKLSLIEFCDVKTKVISLRATCIEMLVRTLSILEYHAVYLYFLEETSNDTKYSVRFPKEG